MAKFVFSTGQFLPRGIHHIANATKDKGRGHLSPVLLTSADWANPIHSGWLQKEGGSHKSIKLRFFVIQSNRMIYFKTNDIGPKSKPIGFFLLEYGTTVGILPRDAKDRLQNKTYKWQVVTTTRTWEFGSQTLEEMEEWIKVISIIVYPDFTFGFSIRKIIERGRKRGYTSDLPLILTKTIGFLRESGAINVEGIFRLSGDVNRIKYFKHLFNTKHDEAIVIPPDTDVHVITGLLRLFLRELAEPLVPENLCSSWLSIRTVNPHKHVSTARDIIAKIPKDNLCWLEYIMQYLAEVAAHSLINKMHAQNLAVIFAPCIMRSQGSGFQDTELHVMAVCFMIEHFNSIFPGSKPIQTPITHGMDVRLQQYSASLPTLPPINAAIMQLSSASTRTINRATSDLNQLSIECSHHQPQIQSPLSTISSHNQNSEVTKDTSYNMAPNVQNALLMETTEDSSQGAGISNTLSSPSSSTNESGSVFINQNSFTSEKSSEQQENPVPKMGDFITPTSEEISFYNSVFECPTTLENNEKIGATDASLSHVSCDPSSNNDKDGTENTSISFDTLSMVSHGGETSPRSLTQHKTQSIPISNSVEPFTEGGASFSYDTPEQTSPSSHFIASLHSTLSEIEKNASLSISEILHNPLFNSKHVYSISITPPPINFETRSISSNVLIHTQEQDTSARVHRSSAPSNTGAAASSQLNQSVDFKSQVAQKPLLGTALTPEDVGSLPPPYQDEIGLWLWALGEDYLQYYDSLIGEGFKKVVQLLDLDEGDLFTLNIKMAHRKGICNRLQKFRLELEKEQST